MACHKVFYQKIDAAGDPNFAGLGARWPVYNVYTDKYLNIDVPPVAKSGFSTWTP
jgi:hypothetical protein